MDYFYKLDSLNKAVGAFMAVYTDFAILGQESYLGLVWSQTHTPLSICNLSVGSPRWS